MAKSKGLSGNLQDCKAGRENVCSTEVQDHRIWEAWEKDKSRMGREELWLKDEAVNYVVEAGGMNHREKLDALHLHELEAQFKNEGPQARRQ